MELYVNTDGGARGNPGPSGLGVVFSCGEEVVEYQKYIGTATNNVAEYSALHLALEHVPLYLSERSAITHITIRMDSELVVRQLQGIYKIKEPSLQALATTIRAQLSKLPVGYAFQHVPRKENAQADRLVNQVLDQHLASNAQSSSNSKSAA